VKHILLVGAGHAHAVVLKKLVEKPLYGARVALVSPAAKQLYSGMLPGVLAGLYRRHQAEIDVARLAEAAYAEFIEDEVVALDPARRIVRLDRGGELTYDFLSLNAGSRVDTSVPGSESALKVKPFEPFVRDVSFPPRVAIAGGGAAGAELAMAFRHRGCAVTLFSERSTFENGFDRRVTAALRARGVDFRPGHAVTRVEPGPVVFSGTAQQAFDQVVWTTGAVALPWLASSGLESDGRGFALVDETLRSVSHPEVFAAGDCATVRGAEHPKSGLYSVRHGELLALNLVNLVSEQPLKPYRPQKRGLVLLSCGNRYAVAGRGGWSAEGRWVWRWKDWIDRRWVRSLAV
jgi:selenide, water dikinase